jgi:PAS domain S-box-containing protein
MRGSEKDLSKSERYYRTLIHSLHEDLLVIDRDYRITDINNMALKTLGKMRQEVIGRLCYEVSHGLNEPCDKHGSPCPLQQVFETGEPVNCRHEHVMSTGTIVHVDILTSPIKDSEGNVTHVIEAIRDISDLFETQEALRASEEKLGEAARIAHVGWWERDFLAKTITLSEEACQIFGLPQHYRFYELTGWHEQWIKLIHPEDQHRTAQAAADALAGGSGYNVNYRVVRSDGEVRYVHSYAEVRRDESGKPLRMFGTMIDITERVQAEEALKVSEAKYVDLYENAPDMYASVNAKTALIEECNIALANTLGYPKEEIIGRPVFEIYHPDCLEEVKNAFKLFVEIGEIHDKELQLRRKDGSKLDVSLNASAVRGENGQILYSRSTLRDITERKRNNAINSARLHLIQFALTHSLDELLEETLNEAEKVTDSLIGFYHFVEDDQKSLTLQNWSARTKAEFCKAKGKGLHYPIAEAGVWVDCVYQGKPVIHNDYASLPHRKGMPQGHAEVIRELVVPVWRGNKIKAILGVGNKPADYTEKDVEAISLLADLAWEIAERKQAEEALRKNEERYRELYERSPLAYESLDAEGCFINVNQAWLDMLGYTREEVIAQWCGNFLALHQVELFRERFPLFKAAGKVHTEFEMKHKDGSIITVAVDGKIGYDEKGVFKQTHCILHDITERKKVEEEIRKLTEELEGRVVERTAQLEAANRELEAFAYSVSHDLRAPLRHIDGFMGLLQKRSATALDEPSRHYMDTISDSVKRMDVLIEDLLAFSRMGRYEMSKGSIDVGDLVQEVIREFEPEAGNRNIHWLLGDLPVVTGDRAMLRVVLINLISNALKFTQPRQQTEIEIGWMRTQETETVIFVRDNGVGFDMNYADKLFGVFQRLHSTDEFEGTGIGLANVRRIINRHGGRTWATGELNQGATFYFSLP